MIPNRKKTPEEIAALREGLGIPDALPALGAPRQRPGSFPPIENAASPSPPSERKIEPIPAPILDHLTATASNHSIAHLEVAPAPFVEKKPAPLRSQHSLRKHELPLAPAQVVTHKTVLPTGRHDDKDIAELRRRDAIKSLTSEVPDPATHLRKMTAGPFLLAPTYIVALAAGAAAWQHVHYVTPLALLLIASLLTIFIFIRKKRSRHHSAILTIIILMTLVFGGLHYAPLFNHAP